MVAHQNTSGTDLAGPADTRTEQAEPGTVAPAPRTEQPAHRPSPADVAKPIAPAPRPTPPGGTLTPAPAPPHGSPSPAPPPPATASGVPTPPAATIVHPVSPASNDPAKWGRVDSDGTVYLCTVDGERAVGSWQAGAPDEGLAHFARRFDDLLTEAELLSTRLGTGGGDPKHTLHSARQLRNGLIGAAVVGDVDGLTAHLDALIAQANMALDDVRAARDASRTRAVTRKEELALEAEQLANDTTQWKQAGDRFKAILDEWRTIKGIDRKTDEQLWKRFSKARDGFNRRRGSHFADLDRQRSTAKARKEELVLEAESLADSTDWGPTASRYKELMAEWKAAGRAQKDSDDVLWQRFRIAQESFFNSRSATFAERDAEFADNASRKEQLLAEAERIDTAKPDAARAALRSIHERWEAVGKVPRERIRELEDRLRAIEDRLRDELDRRWRRSDPEVDARVAQFRERVAQFESQAAKARAAGDTRRAEQAESQAEQWREWLATAAKAVQR
jgi:Domain of Unknown Function (DUF349)